MATGNNLPWDEEVLNLMGNKDFDPALPNVFKWDMTYQRTAGDFIAYVDILRGIGCPHAHAWAIVRRVASCL